MFLLFLAERPVSILYPTPNCWQQFYLHLSVLSTKSIVNATIWINLKHYVRQKESDTRIHIVLFRLYEIQTRQNLLVLLEVRIAVTIEEDRQHPDGRPQGLIRVLVMLFIDLSVSYMDACANSSSSTFICIIWYLYFNKKWKTKQNNPQNSKNLLNYCECFV